MTNKEIEQAEKELNKIEKMLLNEQGEPMKEWLAKYPVSVPLKYMPNNIQWMTEALGNAHRFLQTKMMFNACVSAKWSCRWAAIAAAAALIAAMAACVTVLLTLR